MSKKQTYILVLWSSNFDEVQTAFFVTRLRKAGFTVKLVGLSGPKCKGSQGLSFLLDLTLSQALPLAENTICIIVPSGEACLLLLESDPRIRILFDQARSNGAYIVVPTLGSYPPVESSVLSAAVTGNVLLVYEGDWAIGAFVERLLELLSYPSPHVRSTKIYT